MWLLTCANNYIPFKRDRKNKKKKRIARCKRVLLREKSRSIICQQMNEQRCKRSYQLSIYRYTIHEPYTRWKIERRSPWLEILDFLARTDDRSRRMHKDPAYETTRIKVERKLEIAKKLEGSEVTTRTAAAYYRTRNPWASYPEASGISRSSFFSVSIHTHFVLSFLRLFVVNLEIFSFDNFGPTGR